MSESRARVVRVVLVVAAIIVGVGLLGRGIGGNGAQTVVLDVPPAGQAAPAELPDGTPVFVSHEPDGNVHVVEAVNPHAFWGVTTLVGWCRQAGAFESPLDGSRFDAAGRHLYGPAPRDLATYTTTRNGDVVLVGDRVEAAGRSLTGDPAVRQWCGGSVATLDPDGGSVVFDGLVTELVAHTGTATAELLAIPGEQVRWCEGIQATNPPRCAETVVVLDTPPMEGDLAWSWEGPVRGAPTDPDGLQLLPGGREEYPARGTLTRVFGRVQRLITVADTLRLVINRKVVFADFFTTARPVELGEPLPRPWRIEDQDGPVQSTFTLPGVPEEEALAYVGELVDMTVAGNSRILGIELLPGVPR